MTRASHDQRIEDQIADLPPVLPPDEHKFEGPAVQERLRKLEAAEARRKKRNKAIGIAGTAVVITGGVITVAALTSGGEKAPNTAEAPDTTPTNGGDLTPTSVAVVDPTTGEITFTESSTDSELEERDWAKERAEMVPIYSTKELVSPNYFQTNGKIDANIDKLAIEQTLNNLFYNRSTCIVTGDKDCLLATYGISQFSNSKTLEVSVQTEISIIEGLHEQDKKRSEQDPDYPVTTMVVDKINSIEPITPTGISVTAEVTTVSYTPSDIPGKPPVMIKTKRLMSFELDKNTIKGWSGGDNLERTMWIIAAIQDLKVLGS